MVGNLKVSVCVIKVKCVDQITYKQAKRIQTSDNGKVSGTIEPYLDIEYATADLRPLERLITLKRTTKVALAMYQDCKYYQHA